ncbi:Holliday junction branch migration protein RuvA [Patescibacteria group bacterium]|nr:Holliday junction branch migration protein RuvA [Patescibacteria group bacterium]
MIAYLKGRIIKKLEKGVILENQGIGYMIFIPKNLFEQLNDEMEFFIYNNVKEDAFDLYGFINYENLEFFKKLISINGIGPKVGLEIISQDQDKLTQAILEGDDKYISKTPGIGAKTAKRIILELKGKLDLTASDRPFRSLDKQTCEEVKEALQKFGYRAAKINDFLSELPEEITKTEDIIQYFLKNA